MISPVREKAYKAEPTGIKVQTQNAVQKCYKTMLKLDALDIKRAPGSLKIIG